MNLGVIAHFAIATVLPAIVAAILESERIKHKIDINSRWWQLLCGLVFGVVAVFGTEFGIHTEDATMNVRDAAPIVAGLCFGGPAGIIAGLIGGIERWFSVLWGRGVFTRMACSIATCFAGVYAALLRKFVFEDQRPSWPLACVTGMVAEVLHLLLIFMTNPQEPTKAFFVVRACTLPMIGCNGIAAALAVLALMRVSGHWRRPRSETPDIARVVQSRLLTVIAFGFVVSSLFTGSLQGNISKAQTSELLSLALNDTQSDTNKASDDNLLSLARQAAFAIPYLQAASNETAARLAEELDVAEVHVVDEYGIIVASSDEQYVGFDMSSGEQSAEFLSLLPGGSNTQLVQSYQPSAFSADQWRRFAGVRIKDGFVQVSYDANRYLEDLTERVDNSVRNRHVGQNGALVVVAENGSLVGTRADLVLNVDQVAGLIKASEAVPEGELYTCDFRGKPHFATCRVVEGFRFFALQPVEEAELARDASVLVLGYLEVLVFATLFVAVYRLIRNEVVRSIWQVNGTLDQITQGDLKAEVSVRNNAEFISLSRGINDMVASLRDAIAAEATRIDNDLEYARAIQESALPRTFPPFPQIDAFDIYAQMDPAREVGGDFYDFFLIDDHTLGFLIADVAGKGIPASLFMMAAKTELANHIASGMPLADAVRTANWHLCQGNESGMFVTVWAATLNYETGELIYVNAGHNPPLLRHNGTWEWLRTRGGLFLGTFDTARYRSNTLTLTPGDELLLYTDGVNEAFSAQDEQYGDDRLEAFLTDHALLHPHPLVDALHTDLAHWATGAEQSDDITILALEYGVAPQATDQLTVPATLDHFGEVLDFLHSALHDRTCPIATQHQLDIVLEELFVNVCNYAYADQDEPGMVTLEYVYNVNPSAITVSLTDNGMPFDPLEHSDPTKPTSIDDAKIGGLGIFMVKRMTDDLSYLRDEDKNIVVFVKSW